MARTHLQALSYRSASELTFGRAVRPLRLPNGLEIGAGRVLPEVNFTLPPMTIEASSMKAVRERFTQMVGRVIERAAELGQNELVVEVEHLFELTRTPDWGAAITADLRELLDRARDEHGVAAALRVTIADIRDQKRPPKMRSGEAIDAMLEAFDRSAAAGADILSIESTGGKEVSDDALMQGDLTGVLYALGVLAPRDMEYLWDHITAIAARHGVVAGGDTACGFANTAMQLAHQGMLPKVMAAIVRLAAAPRSLVAVECGATGPLKDCGYENPVIKAIAGVPISMEGKSSACAHSSPVGNIAAAACDLWSNESVQDVRLLGGFAPEIFGEILSYDCRLMNRAIDSGNDAMFRDLLVTSDVDRDPQALVLDPAVMFRCAQAIVEAGTDDWRRVRAAAHVAVDVIEEALTSGRIALAGRELRWYDIAVNAVRGLPESVADVQAQIDATYGTLYRPEEYGM